MNLPKYLLYALLICLSLIGVFVPQITHSLDSSRCNYNPEMYRNLELTKLSQELNHNGLIGRIHGAANPSQMFVMSVREPNNFFSHREFSLIPQNKNNINTLNQANRHDLVCVRGDLIANPSPQKHIKLKSIQVLESWAQSEEFAPYKRHTANLPNELTKQTSLIGKVHAIGEQGKILVMEYKGGVIPIFVTTTKYTQSLYRGDIIQLAYQVQTYPQRPIHLQLNTTVAEPIKIIDAIAAWNNQAKTLSGHLVKFPQSPQLKFDVYAIEVETKGIKRYFTLINFEDMAKFEDIRQKLAKIWDDNLTTAVSGRNMLINPAVTIEAKGIANVVSPNQANPQILLDSVDEVRQLQ